MLLNSFNDFLSLYYPYFENYTANQKPPTLYSLLESYAKYNKDNRIPILNLASYGRNLLFNFDYNLIGEDKEKFEEMIINEFLERRIGAETFTSFYLHFKNKILENIDKYNLLFSSIEDYKITDGESIESTRDFSGNTLNNTTSSTTGKSKFNDTPQSELAYTQDERYLTNYTVTDTDGHASNSGTEKTTETYKSKKSINNQLENIIKFQNQYKNIYTIIFNDLNECFYQLA